MKSERSRMKIAVLDVDGALEDAGAVEVYRDCAELVEAGFPENVERVAR